VRRIRFVTGTHTDNGVKYMKTNEVLHTHGDDVALGDVVFKWREGGAVAGPIALVRTGDIIDVDVDRNILNVRVSDEEMAKRKSQWSRPKSKVERGYLTLWANYANPASKGGGLPYLPL